MFIEVELSLQSIRLSCLLDKEYKIYTHNHFILILIPHEEKNNSLIKNCRIIIYFWWWPGFEPRPCIFYALPIPTELNSYF